MTITLTREEAQQVLDALECMNEGAFNAEIKLLRARLAQPEPEPVMLMDAPLLLNGQPLYTAPPQREWQGLTAAEMMALFPRTNDILEKRIADFAIAIEAKLKEKNTHDRPPR